MASGDQNYQSYNVNQTQQTQDQFYYDQQQQQQYNNQQITMPQAPPGKNSRPFVDPDAHGEVDPTSYPAPKESTSKIRGRSDIMEKLFGNSSHELVIAKVFYFFFFSAFGSLFPLMAVFFKQIGLNPGQTGFLIGCRPFIEFVAAPFWGAIADRFQKRKVMLLCSLAAWIIFTLSIQYVTPPEAGCLEYDGRNYAVRFPDSKDVSKRNVNPADYSGTASSTPHLPVLPHFFHKRSADSVLLDETLFQDTNLTGDHEPLQTHRSLRTKRYTHAPPSHVTGMSPDVIDVPEDSEYYKDYRLVSPSFSSIVYYESDVQKAFFLLLLLVLLGEFFSCPAIILADTAVLGYLGDDADQYGSQRMFGSLGWGLAMFFVGIALDHSTVFPTHYCGAKEQERNYTTCFFIFIVLMGCALLTATQFKFDYTEAPSNTIPLEEAKEPVDTGPRPWNEPKIPMQQTKTGRQQFQEAIGSIKTRIFANTMKEMPEWLVVLREFKSLRCGAFLFVSWWMGFGIGVIFAFLFWHLQDYEGTPTVFGIASIINHISEIFAYFFSFRLIAHFGHVKVLCIGLAGNVIRFLYISWIKNPWAVLPFEFIQGITHASVWAACCSYIAHNTKPELRGSAQGVLQGLHHGIGRGSGAIIGGIFATYFGTSVVFRGYGVVSLFVLAAFIFINFYRKDVGFQHDLPPEEDPRQMAEEGTALAPHGVPANPLPRALSSQKLNEMNDPAASYGTYSTNGMLDIPGGGGGATTNPFMQGDTGGGGTGYQHTSNPVGDGISAGLGTEHGMPTFPASNPFREEALTKDVLNYKGSPVNSPDFSPDYESIKNEFQAYNLLLSDLSEGKYKNFNDESFSAKLKSLNYSSIEPITH